MSTNERGFIINIRKDTVVIFSLAIVIAVCYGQVYLHSFIWDTVHIFQHEQLHQFTRDNFFRIFSHTIIANWRPVSWLSHMLDLSLFGQFAAGHHLINVILHITNSALVFLTIKQLVLRADEFHPGKAVLMGATSALIFAVHPLRVESVVWVAQRKDLLYSMFTLLSIMAYLRYTDLGKSVSRKRFYVVAILLFLLALLSNSMAVTLPVVLLVLDWYPLRRMMKLLPCSRNRPP